MTIRIKNKFKFCRLYRNDVWGKIFIRKKITKFTRIRKPRPKTNISIGDFTGIMHKRSKYFRKRRSRYGKRLAIKQKLLKFYGALNQIKFKKYLLKQKKNKRDVFRNVINNIEKRLDVILFRSNLVSSIFDAKALILQRKIVVNNKIINKPSYKLKPEDKILFRDPYRLWRKLKKTKFVWGYCTEHMFINWKTLKINMHSDPSINNLIYPFKLRQRKLLEFFKI